MHDAIITALVAVPTVGYCVGAAVVAWAQRPAVVWSEYHHRWRAQRGMEGRANRRHRRHRRRIVTRRKVSW